MAEFYTLDELIDLDSRNQLRTVNVNFDQVNKVTQTQGNNFRDVHQYDGQLATKSTVLSSYSQQQKQELLQKLQKILRNPISKFMADRIMMDDGMVDSSNHVKPSDMLAQILSMKMSTDIFLLLEEQLADNMMLGQCPQGRTNRMSQILVLCL